MIWLKVSCEALAFELAYSRCSWSKLFRHCRVSDGPAVKTIAAFITIIFIGVDGDEYRRFWFQSRIIVPAHWRHFIEWPYRLSRIYQPFSAPRRAATDVVQCGAPRKWQRMMTQYQFNPNSIMSRFSRSIKCRLTVPMLAAPCLLLAKPIWLNLMKKLNKCWRR